MDKKLSLKYSNCATARQDIIVNLHSPAVETQRKPSTCEILVKSVQGPISLQDTNYIVQIFVRYLIQSVLITSMSLDDTDSFLGCCSQFT
jgi:hypothetical protein